MKLRLPHNSRAAAFTLLEVVLAVFIAVGIFLVAFSLHHQAASLRAQLLLETERLGAVRQLFERMSSDLQSARPDDWQGFYGTSNTIEFVKLDIPLKPNLWQSSNQTTRVGRDLKLVRYGLLTAIQGTNLTVLGLDRKETGLAKQTEMKTNAPVTVITNFVPDLSVTNQAAAEPLTELVQGLAFRYWDGQGWAESWSDIVPPRGVEISIWLDAPDLWEGEPPEVFRRVVFIPAGVPAERSDHEPLADLMTQ